MVKIHTKNLNLGTFWRALENIGMFAGRLECLRPFGIQYGHLVILWSFGLFSHVLVYCT
jgi:hypothetical protein